MKSCFKKLIVLGLVTCIVTTAYTEILRIIVKQGLSAPHYIINGLTQIPRIISFFRE